MYEKQNMHYAFHVFPERNVRNVIFRFLFTRQEKVRVNRNLFLFGHVRFITNTNSGHSTTVEDKIKSARGCAYSLMGASLHGENGGNPRVSLSLWNTYVLPRLTYGLDVLTLSYSEIQKLNQFHKKFLKQVIHLHKRTADMAVYYTVRSAASGGRST